MRVTELIAEDERFYCKNCCSNKVQIKYDRQKAFYEVCGCPYCKHPVLGINDYTQEIHETINQILEDIC